jgi:hypothetical protein
MSERAIVDRSTARRTAMTTLDSTLGHDTTPHDPALGESPNAVDLTLGHDTTPHDPGYEPGPAPLDPTAGRDTTRHDPALGDT